MCIRDSNDIDDDGGDAQNEILHHLGLMGQDKLRKQGGQKNNADVYKRQRCAYPA